MIENEAANELDRRRIRRKSPRIKIGDVTYLFLQNLSAALKPICVTVYKNVVSDLIPLTPVRHPIQWQRNSVCSAAGKRTYAVEKKKDNWD